MKCPSQTRVKRQKGRETEKKTGNEQICLREDISLRKQPSFFAPVPSGVSQENWAGSEEGRLFSQARGHEHRHSFAENIIYLHNLHKLL